MVYSAPLRCIALVSVSAAAACARAAQPDSLARPDPAGRVAALDSATARRLCAAPESVLAGRAPCVLQDQAAPPPVRPVPQP